MMAPRKIKRLAVQYEDGEIQQWEGKGNAAVRGNMVPENEQHETPKPHKWDEVTVVMRIKEVGR